MVLPAAPEFESLVVQFPPQPGTRSVIVCEVTRIADSCGFGVPLYEHIEGRDTLAKYTVAKGEEGMKLYRAEKNQVSIDGLPALIVEATAG